MAVQAGSGDWAGRLARLAKDGDLLVTSAEPLNFEPFRYRLEKALKRSDGANCGRSPYDPVRLFKVLALLALYNPSDNQAVSQIRRRHSRIPLSGLNPGVASPDAKTIGLFREQLVWAKAIEKLFALFDVRWTMIGVKCATIKNGMANRANNFERRGWQIGRTAPA
jgi:hypothetical protein